MMKEEKSDIRPDPDCDPANPPKSDTANQQTISTRRDLIGHFGKASIAAGHLLLFVTNPKAVHSKP